MPRVTAVYFCETALVDGRTNQLSLINLVDSFNFQAVPAVVLKLTMVVLLDRENDPNDRHTLHLSMHNNALPIYEIANPVTFLGQNNARLIHQISGLPVQQVGNLTIRVQVDGSDETESRDIPVRIVQPVQGNVA